MFFCNNSHKSKIHPRTSLEGPEGEEKYSSTLSLNSALNWGGWLAPSTGRFTLGTKIHFPLYRIRGEPKDRSGRVRKISPPPELDPRTVQNLASRYKN
jgi:hypothetical protein